MLVSSLWHFYLKPKYAEQQLCLKELQCYRQVLEQLRPRITLRNEEYRLLQQEYAALIRWLVLALQLSSSYWLRLIWTY